MCSDSAENCFITQLQFTGKKTFTNKKLNDRQILRTGMGSRPFYQNCRYFSLIDKLTLFGDGKCCFKASHFFPGTAMMYSEGQIEKINS